MSIIITNGKAYLPDYHFHTATIEIEKECITQVSTNDSTYLSSPHGITDSDSPCEILDAANCYIIPGLIDIHFHGCAGVDFCDGSPDSLHRIASYQASQGITGICPASMTLPMDILLKITESATDYFYRKKDTSETDNSSFCADFLGIRLEGPFLSAAKCGAQNPAFLHKPDVTLFHKLQDKAKGLIRIVDIAPEEDNDCSFIREISKECKVSLAHTAADYATCMNAFAAGASHVTHLFNAMSEFSHRKPGLIGAACDTPACDVELICDGVHVDPSVIRMAFQLYTDARIVLISDSMQATGMPNGEYTLGGQTVKVSGILATLADGTIAGSVTNLMDCVRHAVAFSIPLESAIRCATANPARSIGVDNCYGYLKPGYVANIVILNPDLSLRHVILHGKIIV